MNYWYFLAPPKPKIEIKPSAVVVNENLKHVTPTPIPAVAANERLSSSPKSLSTESVERRVNKDAAHWHHAHSVDSSCSEVATPAVDDCHQSYWTSDEDSFDDEDDDDAASKRFGQQRNATPSSLAYVRTYFVYSLLQSFSIGLE